MGFEISRSTSLSAVQAWDRLTDWERHSAAIPLTSVTRWPGSATGVGSGFTGRTSLGPVGFDDPMEVTFWQPPEGDRPGVCRIVKHGRVVVGWAVLVVTPEGSGSTVTWREEADIRFGGALLRRPNAIVGKAVFSRLVDHLLSD